jgi:AcrR family transcriptional regulator
MIRTVKTQPPARRYDATGRRAAAQETRRRLAEAAREIFLQQGYTAARMADIAAAAGVSHETLYSAFGPKAKLVRHLIDIAISGADEPVPPQDRAWVREVEAEPDPARKIELFARGIRLMQERTAPLWSVVLAAAATDSELKALVDELNARRATHMRLFVDDLARSGGLRPGQTPEAANDVIWAMTSSEFYVLFVLERGWSPEAFEAWVADAWKRLLLPAK